MANYFQTDDRDDFFESLSKNKKERKKDLFTIQYDGTIILKDVRSYKGVTFTKTLINKTRKELGNTWKEELQNLGYSIKIN